MNRLTFVALLSSVVLLSHDANANRRQKHKHRTTLKIVKSNTSKRSIERKQPTPEALGYKFLDAKAYKAMAHRIVKPGRPLKQTKKQIEKDPLALGYKVLSKSEYAAMAESDSNQSKKNKRTPEQDAKRQELKESLKLIKSPQLPHTTQTTKSYDPKIENTTSSQYNYNFLERLAENSRNYSAEFQPQFSSTKNHERLPLKQKNQETKSQHHYRDKLINELGNALGEDVKRIAVYNFDAREPSLRGELRFVTHVSNIRRLEKKTQEPNAKGQKRIQTVTIATKNGESIDLHGSALVFKLNDDKIVENDGVYIGNMPDAVPPNENQRNR